MSVGISMRDAPWWTGVQSHAVYPGQALDSPRTGLEKNMKFKFIHHLDGNLAGKINLSQVYICIL